MRSALLVLFLLLSLPRAGHAASAREGDMTPRTAVLTAFEPEWKALQSKVRDPKHHRRNGIDFLTGTIEGKPVVVLMTGISMVNAAMAAQMALGRFSVQRIIFSGIAGGVDPSLHIGDVVVPDQWREYLESVFARQTGTGYTLPAFIGSPQTENFGMIFPQPVQINRAPERPAYRAWFPVDAGLLALAREVARSVVLRDCSPTGTCLDQRPSVVVGGNGVSGPAFVDNAAFRTYVQRVFDAEALDMESAAVAHVAYVNKVPFIAFRSLSDLAGGDATQNQMKIFEDVAASNSAAVVTAFLHILP